MQLQSTIRAKITQRKATTRPCRKISVVCRDRTVFQSYEHIQITQSDIDDCIYATTKLNIDDKINFANCIGVNLINVYKYKGLVDQLNTQYYGRVDDRIRPTTHNMSVVEVFLRFLFA